MCYCIDRLPTLDAACSISEDDYSDKCSVDNIGAANTKPAVEAVVCRENKPKVQFVVPIKRKSANVRNDRLMGADERGVDVNVARPVVMQTLSHTQTSTDKRSSVLSSVKLSDLPSILTTSDTHSTYELLHSSLDGQCSVAKSFEPNVVSQSEAEESVVMDTANDCVVTGNSAKTLLTVNAGDVLHAVQQQWQTSPAADLSIISQSFDIGEHSHMNYLSDKVVDTHEQPSELAFTNDSASSQQLAHKDSVSKQAADKSKLTVLNASHGSLSMSRKNVDCNKVSLKDAVGGTRPRSYSLFQVTSTISNIDI